MKRLNLTLEKDLDTVVEHHEHVLAQQKQRQVRQELNCIFVLSRILSRLIWIRLYLDRDSPQVPKINRRKLLRQAGQNGMLITRANYRSTERLKKNKNYIFFIQFDFETNPKQKCINSHQPPHDPWMFHCTDKPCCKASIFLWTEFFALIKITNQFFNYYFEELCVFNEDK